MYRLSLAAPTHPEFIPFWSSYILNIPGVPGSTDSYPFRSEPRKLAVGRVEDFCNGPEFIMHAPHVRNT